MGPLTMLMYTSAGAMYAHGSVLLLTGAATTASMTTCTTDHGATASTHVMLCAHVLH